MPHRYRSFDLPRLIRRLCASPQASIRSTARLVGCSPSTVRRYSELLEQSGWTRADLEGKNASELLRLLTPAPKAAIDIEAVLAVLTRPGGTVRQAWDLYCADAQQPRKTHLSYKHFARKVAAKLQRQYVPRG